MVNFLLRIQVILPTNDIEAISQGLKKIGVGGITAFKGLGRGKSVPKGIHASKGSEIFVPEFSQRYILEVIIPENKKDEAVEIIRANSKLGKIFISEITEALDIPSPKKNEEAI
jgi:nitrogen regulatory protein P-II 1